jgi:hypothetical protein
VGSLVFVGLEIRQSAEATRTATVQDVVDGWREINIWLATDPSWVESRLVFAEAEDPSHLDYSTSRTLQAGWRTLFHQWMIGHYHFTQGTLPEDLWSGFVVEIEGLRGNTSMRWVWETEGPKYAPAFQAFMNGILAAD